MTYGHVGKTRLVSRTPVIISHTGAKQRPLPFISRMWDTITIRVLDTLAVDVLVLRAFQFHLMHIVKGYVSQADSRCSNYLPLPD